MQFETKNQKKKQIKIRKRDKIVKKKGQVDKKGDITQIIFWFFFVVHLTNKEL